MDDIMKMSLEELRREYLQLKSKLEETEKSKSCIYGLYETERKKLAAFKDAVKSIVILIE